METSAADAANATVVEGWETMALQWTESDDCLLMDMVKKIQSDPVDDGVDMRGLYGSTTALHGVDWHKLADSDHMLDLSFLSMNIVPGWMDLLERWEVITKEAEAEAEEAFALERRAEEAVAQAAAEAEEEKLTAAEAEEERLTTEQAAKTAEQEEQGGQEEMAVSPARSPAHSPVRSEEQGGQESQGKDMAVTPARSVYSTISAPNSHSVRILDEYYTAPTGPRLGSYIKTAYGDWAMVITSGFIMVAEDVAENDRTCGFRSEHLNWKRVNLPTEPVPEWLKQEFETSMLRFLKGAEDMLEPGDEKDEKGDHSRDKRARLMP
jgi:hypothetical protein